MGSHRIKVSFTTPRKDTLEKALYWDYYEEMEPMVNRTSSQAGQFPFIEVSMAKERYRRKKTHAKDDFKKEEKKNDTIGENSCVNEKGDT